MILYRDFPPYRPDSPPLPSLLTTATPPPPPPPPLTLFLLPSPPPPPPVHSPLPLSLKLIYANVPPTNYDGGIVGRARVFSARMAGTDKAAIAEDDLYPSGG